MQEEGPGQEKRAHLVTCTGRVMDGTRGTSTVGDEMPNALMPKTMKPTTTRKAKIRQHFGSPLPFKKGIRDTVRTCIC